MAGAGGEGGGGRDVAAKTWGRASLRDCVRSAHWSSDRTSAKDGEGRIMGMKEACFSKRSLSPMRRMLMSRRSWTGSPSSRSSSVMALRRWQ